jgi:hypothetical protein
MAQKPTKKTPAMKKAAAKKATGKKASPRKAASGTPRLLAGDNPQIAKGEGDAVVQEYLAATPGWKGDVVRRLDAVIQKAVPRVHKAVKWNTPLYGIEGDGWFVSYHCYDKYVKVAFFRGTSLDPMPPGASKTPETRYLDIREDDEIDERQLTRWVKQASKLPGERM